MKFKAKFMPKLEAAPQQDKPNSTPEDLGQRKEQSGNLITEQCRKERERQKGLKEREAAAMNEIGLGSFNNSMEQIVEDSFPAKSLDLEGELIGLLNSANSEASFSSAESLSTKYIELIREGNNDLEQSVIKLEALAKKRRELGK